MKQLIIAFALLTFGFNSQAQTWSADVSHSNVVFTTSHMIVSDVDGSFKKFEATMASSKADFSDAKIKMDIVANSINTDNEKRDAHLKSPDFFEVDKYESISFESTSVKSLGNGKLSISGKLSMHGVTKNVTFVATYKVGTNIGNQKTIAGFKINGKLNRKDYEIGTSTPVAVVGDEVIFKINLEMVKG
ncbi:MAG TPA: YceI family protein [Chitinophagaceae bacterium]|nr:YceI family protein [Chitinophagaceae bacterium]